MATHTYYAYRVPSGMTDLDFAIMIGKETDGKVLTSSVSRRDNVAVLTFREPGCYAEYILSNVIPVHQTNTVGLSVCCAENVRPINVCLL